MTDTELAWNDNLPNDQKEALSLFTGRGYKRIKGAEKDFHKARVKSGYKLTMQEAINNTRPKHRELLEISQSLSDTARTGVYYKGLIHRNLPFKNKEAFDKYMKTKQVGSIATFDSTQSFTAWDEWIVAHTGYKPDYRIQLSFKKSPKRSALIRAGSNVKGEGEVIVDRRTKYKVVSHKTKKLKAPVGEGAYEGKLINVIDVELEEVVE